MLIHKVEAQVQFLFFSDFSGSTLQKKTDGMADRKKMTKMKQYG